MYHLTRFFQYIQRIFFLFFAGSPLKYKNKRSDYLRNLYATTNRFLKNLEVEYWLDYGTLLGYYREGDIIGHDIDIDFGAREKYYEKIRSNDHLLPSGFSLYDTSDRHYGPKLYISYRGFDADIYFYEENDSLKPYEKTKWKNESKALPRELFFPLKEARFLDSSTFVPNRTEEYLVRRYGYLGGDGVRDKETGFWYKEEAG